MYIKRQLPVFRLSKLRINSFFKYYIFCDTQFSVVKLYNLEFCRKSKHDIRFLSNFISYIIFAGPVDCVNISLSLVLNEYKEIL